MPESENLLESEKLLHLESRMAALESRQQITDLVARYGLAIDDREIDKLGATFTEDGIFVQYDGSFKSEGRTEIMAYYQERVDAYTVSYHYPHSHLIDLVDDTHGAGIVCGHAELGVEGRTFVAGLRYHDQYERVDGSWLFAERRLAMVYYMDLAELADGGLSLEDRKRYFGVNSRADLPYWSDGGGG